MINVVKIGGKVIDDEQLLAKFVTDFSAIRGGKILVHGGGNLATQLGGQLGVQSQFVEGRRITSEPMLRIAVMAYAGWINKRIVALLQASACNAMGLCGADANTLPAVRRAPSPVDYGYVGDITAERINAPLLQMLIAQNITPVFSAITHDTHGNLLNSNADGVAAAIAAAMSKAMPVRLIYCFEKNGVLRDINDADSVIPELTPQTYEEYKSMGMISEGMIPKVDNAFKALQNGAGEVVIKSALHLNDGGGTIIRREKAM